MILSGDLIILRTLEKIDSIMKQNSSYPELEGMTPLTHCFILSEYKLLLAVTGIKLATFSFDCILNGPQWRLSLISFFAIVPMKKPGPQWWKANPRRSWFWACLVKKIRAIHQVWTSWTLREADLEICSLTVRGKSECKRAQGPAGELDILWLNFCKAEHVLCTWGLSHREKTSPTSQKHHELDRRVRRYCVINIKEKYQRYVKDLEGAVPIIKGSAVVCC